MDDQATANFIPLAPPTVYLIDLPTHRPMPPGGYDLLNPTEAQETVVPKTPRMGAPVRHGRYTACLPCRINLAMDMALPTRPTQSIPLQRKDHQFLIVHGLLLLSVAMAVLLASVGYAWLPRCTPNPIGIRSKRRENHTFQISLSA